MQIVGKQAKAILRNFIHWVRADVKRILSSFRSGLNGVVGGGLVDSEAGRLEFIDSRCSKGSSGPPAPSRRLGHRKCNLGSLERSLKGTRQ